MLGFQNKKKFLFFKIITRVPGIYILIIKIYYFYININKISTPYTYVHIIIILKLVPKKKIFFVMF